MMKAMLPEKKAIKKRPMKGMVMRKKIPPMVNCAVTFSPQVLMKRSLDRFMDPKVEVFSKRRMGTVKNVRSAHAIPRREEVIEVASCVPLDLPLPRFSMIFRRRPTIAEIIAQMKSLWIFLKGCLRPSPNVGLFPENRMVAEVMIAA